MQSIVARFLGFDRLIGPLLVKIVYYVGAAGILVSVAMTVFFALIAFAGQNWGAGFMQLVAGPVVGAVALVYWRFVCELFMLAFLAYDRMGEVRDLMRIAAGLASPPDPNHPPF